MSAASIRAGKAFYEILAEDKTAAGWTSAANRAKKMGAAIAGVGASIAAFGGAALGGFSLALKQFTEFGDQIDKFSARTGVSTAWAQSFKVAAELGGASIEDVENGIRKMQKTLAKTGELKGLTPEEQFIALADKINAIQDPTEKAAVAMQYFGKSGTMLIPMLGELRKTSDFLQSNGLILSPEDVKAAAQLNDAWTLLSLSISQTVKIIGASLAPTMIKLVDWFTQGAIAVAQFIDNNRELVRWVAIGAAVVTAIGVALVTVGGIMAGVGMAISGIVAAISAIGAVFAFIASPVGLAVAAVVGLVALLPVAAYLIDKFVFAGAGLKFLGEAFSTLWSIASDTLGGIWDAIADGNWTLAGKIAWAGLSLAFQTGWDWIKIGFAEMFQWIFNRVVDFFGSEFLGTFMRGIRSILKGLNAALGAVGMSKMDLTGVDEFIKRADEGTDSLKEFAKAYVDATREAADINATVGQFQLDVLTAQAAKARKKKIEKVAEQVVPMGSMSTSDNPVEQLVRQAVGVGFSHLTNARIVQLAAPTFEADNEQQKQTKLLGEIADNTKNAGAEFGA